MSSLSLDAIKPLLNDNIHIELFDTIDSTNNYLLAQKNSAITVCIAEHQTNGKGQPGKTWYSPHGENIYLSYACVLPKPMNEIGNLSMQMGEAVCEMLKQFGITDGLSVKRPNDILFQGKKLAGILIEVQPIENNQSRVVIGVGLNINMTADLDGKISQPWTSLQIILGNQIDRSQAVAALVNLIENEARKI